MRITNLRVGVVHWQLDGMIALISEVLNEVGCVVINFDYDAKLPEKLDIVLAFGPFGSLVPVINQLLTINPLRRPELVIWMSEQFPNPMYPKWVWYSIGKFLSWLERTAYHQRKSGEWYLIPPLGWVDRFAHRFRYYGELCCLNANNLLSVFAVGSRWIADLPQLENFDPIVAYYGLPPSPRWGEDLALERDIPVLWIGKLATDRRKRLLYRLRSELRTRGIEILIVDGVENSYVFDEERTVLMNRTKININILRRPWDNNSLRYYLSALNGTLLITEPTLNHIPFENEKHCVEASVEQMAETIYYYLVHESERKRITDQAHQLVTDDLTMRKALVRIVGNIKTEIEAKL